MTWGRGACCQQCTLDLQLSDLVTTAQNVCDLSVYGFIRVEPLRMYNRMNMASSAVSCSPLPGRNLV
jgi:hypothetical protein